MNDAVTGTLKQSAPLFYLSTLHAPASHRPALTALWAYHSEIERVSRMVSEPLPGEIRLQWWRDVLSGNDSGGSPVAVALLEAIERYSLPRETLAAASEARIFDLYNDPMPDLPTFEAWCGETHSVFFQMAARILLDGNEPESGDAAGHAGVAFAIARVLQEAGMRRLRQQVFLPADVLSAAGSSPEHWLGDKAGESAAQVVRVMAGLSRDHLRSAGEAIRSLPQQCHGAFLPLAVVLPLLDRLERAGPEILSRQISLSPLAQQWHLLKASVRGSLSF